MGQMNAAALACVRAPLRAHVELAAEPVRGLRPGLWWHMRDAGWLGLTRGRAAR